MSGIVTTISALKRDSRSILSAFASDESGATAIEYGLIVALIFLAIVTAVNAFSDSTITMYGTIEAALE